MTIVAAAIVVVCSLAGVLLTALTLPGIWFMVLAALLVDLWRGEVLSTGVLITSVVLAVLGEIAEFLASAAGARRAKGSRASALASIPGALAGAIAGSFLIPVPIVGTIVGGVVGAALFAGVAESVFSRTHWRHSLRVAQGAGTGRALALVAKTAIAAAAGLVLSIAACWP